MIPETDCMPGTDLVCWQLRCGTEAARSGLSFEEALYWIPFKASLTPARYSLAREIWSSALCPFDEAHSALGQHD